MLVADGLIQQVPGPFRGVSFLQERSLSVEGSDDCRPRPLGTWISGICLHTRLGLPVKVMPGKGPDLGWDKDLPKRFLKDKTRKASCHVAVDADGSYACLADLIRTITFHAGHVSFNSVGMELYQTPDGIVYESTLESAVILCDALTRILRIQRQYPHERKICRRFASPTIGTTDQSRLAYMEGGARGADFCGVYGHRNATGNRGAGDPGDDIFEHLRAAGYEGWNVDTGADLDTWSLRQKALGMAEHDCDGIPGRYTSRLIQHSGKLHGLWVSRPGDSLHAGT